MTAWASPYLSSAQIRGWAHTWGVALLPGDHSWKHVTPVTCSPKVLSAQGRQVPGPTIFWELKANSRNVNWGNQESHIVRWLWRRRPGANWYLTSAHQGHAGGHGYSSITAPSNSWLPSRSVFRVGASSAPNYNPRHALQLSQPLPEGGAQERGGHVARPAGAQVFLPPSGFPPASDWVFPGFRDCRSRQSAATPSGVSRATEPD